MDVAIVGGGVVGCYLAWRLANYAKITVFEQKQKPWTKACSGLISERLWDFIPEIDIVQNTISHAKIYFRKPIKLTFKPKLLVCDRVALHKFLWRLARKSGVRFLNKRARIPNFDRVIGCDGALSTVRGQLDLPNPYMRLGLLTTFQEHNEANFVEIWPLKGGFCWKLPRGELTEYGTLAPTQNAREEFLNFCIKQNVGLENIKAALVPAGLRLAKNPWITLCGDAAGLTKPWSGGGIIWSFLAANILTEKFPNFQLYEKELKKFFSWYILLGKIASALAPVIPHDREIDPDFLLKK